MSSKTYTKHHCDMMARTIQSYEQAIADLEWPGCDDKDVAAVAREWKYYGGPCRLCGNSAGRPISCRDCLLYNSYSGCVTPLMTSLVNSIGEATRYPEITQELLLKSFKRRLQWILVRVATNGYEVTK